MKEPALSRSGKRALQAEDLASAKPLRQEQVRVMWNSKTSVAGMSGGKDQNCPW